MTGASKRLACCDVGASCEFVGRGTTAQEAIEAVASHGAHEHGMTSFPRELWVQMVRRTRSVGEWCELDCREVAEVLASRCRFVAQGDTEDDIVQALATHWANDHGLGALPPPLRADLAQRVRSHLAPS